MKKKRYMRAALAAALLMLVGCGVNAEADTDTTEETAVVETEISSDETEVTTEVKADSETETETESEEDSDVFTKRDLNQDPDLDEAEYITVTDGEDVTITEAGTYVLSGTASEVTITVNCEDEDAKVQLVLDGLNVTNSDSAVIYVISADKVFVTTADGSENTLTVTGTFTADGETNVDGVIFAKDDLVLNGLGTLTIVSSDNGIVAKDDLKVTGGTYVITAEGHGIDVNDNILINDGDFTIDAGTDGIHCAYGDDDTVGAITIYGGTFNITAGSDGIQAQTTLTIEGGTFDITASEGLEATYVVINDGEIDISASDDGINAAYKSYSMGTPTIEINGGTINIVMGSGDTDGLDANGNLYINGGTVSIECNSPFDYDNDGAINGGTVYVNGEQVTEIYNSMMGGGQMMGGNNQMNGNNGQMDGNTQMDNNNQMNGNNGPMGGGMR